MDCGNTYYEYNKNDVERDGGCMPIPHTSIRVFTLRTKLHEDSNEIMYPIGTPKEIKNTHLKRKYILATEYNKKL